MPGNVCKVCLVENAPLYLDIYAESNAEKNISTIISKYLWFEVTPSNEQQSICDECWNSLYKFHQFYEKVEQVHYCTKDDIGKLELLDNDPFGATEDHFGDESSDEDRTKLFELVKTDPVVVGDENETLLKRDALEETKATRRSTRIRKGKDSGKEAIVPLRFTRRSNAQIEYKAESPSSEEDASDRSECKEAVKIEGSERKRKHSTSNDEEIEDSNSDEEVAPKSERAKRKKDPKLFAHIEEFICYLCPERVEFDRFYHATVHYKKLHNEPAYIKCKICDKRCYTPGNFISHLEVHEDPDKYRCQICGKQNDQQVALAKHMRIHRPELEEKLPIRCSLCPRRFATEQKRDRHELDHDRKPAEKTARIVGRDEELLEFYKRFGCEICDVSRLTDPSVPEADFDNMQDLKRHMRDEHNDKGYLKCHLCEKKCNIRSMLLVHMDFHLNPEKYRCDVCGNIFQNLPKHKEGAHAAPGEATFYCEHCGKALTSEKSLKSHVERKHAVKDVFCDICNKPFSKSTLEAHKRVVHTLPSLMCTKCPKMFRSNFALNRHLDEHEDKVKERVKCSICGVTFKHKYILTKHIDSVHTTEAPVACDVCGKMFKSKHHLWSHKSDTCNTRRFDCTICGRVFKVKVRLNEHMTTHTGKSLYQCTFCPLTFSFQSILYTHRKKAHYEQWLELQQQREEGVKFKVLEAPS
ncbi:transcription factor grauzone-like [Culex pipiens pallens]|uniref:transcription factor grauzone-like n=1 Tax=Culex pipiens pallens TaxID=42434 RepID=UPI001953B14F|nr:transcription factor grauzone-like [Culex pipiens pallens]XP_039448833.1 transcription factor grauzone-like [Culex pipiens pallens]